MTTTIYYILVYFAEALICLQYTSTVFLSAIHNLEHILLYLFYIQYCLHFHFYKINILILSASLYYRD